MKKIGFLNRKKKVPNTIEYKRKTTGKMFDTKDVESKLNKMLLYKQDAKSVHSLFCSDYPVGLGEENKIVIYDIVNGIYKYDQTVTVPMTIPEGTEAAFPIKEKDDCCCVITHSCLAESNYFLPILHEFVHCYQFRSCEDKLKKKLKFYSKAMEDYGYMWELNYKFTYNNEKYRELIQSIELCSFNEMIDRLKILRSELNLSDYEYLVWQIWKEGFARFIENKIRQINGVSENNNGVNEEDTDRTSMYFIGDHIWRKFEKRDLKILNRIEEIFGLLIN